MEFKLIIGLGNDDPQYANTYHNVGHLFADYINAQGGPAHAEKTGGYMNTAGASVARAMKRANAKPETTLLVHDDSDIAIGNFKIAFARGSAGHKGVASVFDTVKSKAFWRLRIGIRPRTATRAKAGLPTDLSAKASASAEAPRAKAGDFVLKKITTAHRQLLKEVFQNAAQALDDATTTATRS